MKESDLTRKVIKIAHQHGWKVAHFHTAQSARGAWITPVGGDGKGFPDLILVRGASCFAVELKMGYRQISQEQMEWLDALEEAGLVVFVWRDRDLEEGTIEKELT